MIKGYFNSNCLVTGVATIFHTVMIRGQSSADSSTLHGYRSMAIVVCRDHVTWGRSVSTIKQKTYLVTAFVLHRLHNNFIVIEYNTFGLYTLESR